MNTWLPYEIYAGTVRRCSSPAFVDASRAADVLRVIGVLSRSQPEWCRAQLLDFASRVTVFGAFGTDDGSSIQLKSEDMLGLATAAVSYAAETGDNGIFSERVAFRDGPEITFAEHCARAIGRCLDSGKGDYGVLERTVRLWLLITGHADHAASWTDMLESRRLSEKNDLPEQRTMPRRVSYFQSLSPTLSEKQAAQRVGECCDSDGTPRGDAASGVCVYSVLVDHTLGITAGHECLILAPHLPDSWCQCSVVRRFRKDTYNIEIRRSNAPSRTGMSMVVDGEPVLGDTIPYFGDGRVHRVEVVVN